MNRTLLRARKIQKSYAMGHDSVHILRGASLEVEAGEFLVVTGASGSGKSTLLHLLGALDHPDSGTVEFRGEDVFTWSDYQRRAYRNRQIGFVFQFYHLLPELNIVENILMARMTGCSFWEWRKIKRQARAEAEEILERTGLSERAAHRPNELSGGERQRVAIARALINRPTLLLADEPTGNLDDRIGTEILGLLGDFNEAGQTIVMVTHDSKVASRAHRRVRLTDGLIRDPESGIAHEPVLHSNRKVAP